MGHARTDDPKRRHDGLILRLTMARSIPLLRPLLRAASAIAGCGLSLIGWLPALAGPQPETFPPAATFRNLQLLALTCSRENTAASCDQARAIADPLLDHPRLPTSCKDVLWSISQKARPAASNTESRRDGIDRAAKDLTLFCKSQTKPTGKGDNKGSGSAGGGNFGLGGSPPAR